MKIPNECRGCDKSCESESHKCKHFEGLRAYAEFTASQFKHSKCQGDCEDCKCEHQS